MTTATVAEPTPLAAIMEGTAHEWERQSDGRYTVRNVPIAVAHNYIVADREGNIAEIHEYPADRLAAIAADANNRGGGTVHVGHKSFVHGNEGRVEGRAVNCRVVGDTFIVDYVDVRAPFMDDAIVQQGLPNRSIEFNEPNGDIFKGVGHLGRSAPFTKLPRIRIEMTEQERQMLRNDVLADASYAAFRSTPADANRDATVSPQLTAIVQQMLQDAMAPLQAALSKLTVDVNTRLATTGKLEAGDEGEKSTETVETEIEARNDKGGEENQENAGEKEMSESTEKDTTKLAEKTDEEGDADRDDEEDDAEEVAEVNLDANRSAPVADDATLSEMQKRLTAEAETDRLRGVAEVAAYRSKLSAAIDPMVFNNAPKRVEAILADAMQFADPASRAKVIEIAENAYRSNAAPTMRLPATVNEKGASPAAVSKAYKDMSNLEFAKAIQESRAQRGISPLMGWTAEKLADAFEQGTFNRERFSPLS